MAYFIPLTGTLKPQSNGQLYSNTVIGLVHWALMGGLLHLVQRGGGLRHRPVPSSLYQM